MFKGLGMALALAGLMGGRSISGKSYRAPPQTAESKAFYIERAKSKRERKARILQERADRGDIAHV